MVVRERARANRSVGRNRALSLCRPVGTGRRCQEGGMSLGVINIADLCNLTHFRSPSATVTPPPPPAPFFSSASASSERIARPFAPRLLYGLLLVFFFCASLRITLPGTTKLPTKRRTHRGILFASFRAIVSGSRERNSRTVRLRVYQIFGKVPRKNSK